MSGKKIIIGIIGLVLLVALIMFINNSFSFFEPENVGMVQYAGSLSDTVWIGTHPYPVDTSNVAKFGDYEIITTKDSDTYRNEPVYTGNEPIYGCEENICNGESDHIDEDGCQIWKKSTPGIVVSCGYRNVCGVNYCSCTESCDCSQMCPCYGDPEQVCPAWYKYGGSGWYRAGYDAQRCPICKKNVPITYEYCGGLKAINIESYCCDYRTCWSKFTIKKNGEIIKEIPWVKSGSIIQTNLDIIDVTEEVNSYLELNSLTFNTPLNTYQNKICNEGYNLVQEEEGSIGDRRYEYYCIDQDFAYLSENNQQFYRESGLIADLFIEGVMQYYSCIRIKNRFMYKIPENAFSFDVSVPDLTILEGKEYSVNIEVTNNWKPVKGKLEVEYELPYRIFGESKSIIELKEEYIEIPNGKTTFSYDIPTDMNYDNIYVTPTFYVLMEGYEFSGVNGDCFKQEDSNVRALSTCDYVLLGTLYGDKENISIVSESEIKELKIQSLESEISELNQLIEERNQIKEDLEESINNMDSEIDNLKDNLEQQTLTIEELKDNLEDKNKKTAELQFLISQAQTQIDDLIGILQDKEDLIKELILERLAQESKILELLENLQEKEEKLAEIEGMSDAQKIEVERIKDMFSEQKVKILELQEIVDEDYSIIDGIKQDNDDMKYTLKELSEKNEDLKDKTDELSETVTQEQQKAEELKTLLEVSKQIAEKLSKENDEQKISFNKIKELSNEQEALINELEKKNKELENLFTDEKSFNWWYIAIPLLLLITFVLIKKRK